MGAFIMPNTPALPPGFTLDSQQAPPLPPGFTVDQPEQAPPVDPRIQLQDLLIEQAKGTPGLGGQIAQLRASLNVPDDSRSVSNPQQIQPEQAGDFGESFDRGFFQGAQTVGTGVLSAGAKGLGSLGVDTGEFQQNLEVSRNIEQQKTKDITKDFPITGTVGEIVGETAVLPFPAAKTAKGAIAGGAALGGLIAEGSGRDPLTGALIGGATGGILKGTEKFVRGKIKAKKETEALLRQGSDDIATATSKLDKSGKVVTDKRAVEAIKQGVSEKMVAGIKPATIQTKQKMDKIVKSIADSRRSVKATNQAPEIIGKSVADRVKKVTSIHRKTGKELDKITRGLKGDVDIAPVIKSFSDDLDKLDIKIRSNRPVFEGSAIQGLRGPQRIIRDVVERGSGRNLRNPIEAHKFKQFLDEQLKSGKASSDGLTGRTVNIIEQLRKGIDDTLDAAHPAYREINSKWSKSKEALDEFQGIIGKKADITQEGVINKLGAIMPRIISNAPGGKVIQANIKKMDEIANASGFKFKDDAELLVNFADELEKLFKTSPGRSLQSQMARGVDLPPQSFQGAAIEGGKKVIKKIQNINEPAAFKALRELLNEQ